MLYLHPPYYMYEGVPVLGDYHDPRQFYYYPNRPQLAVDEAGRPAIRFLVLRENLDELPDDEEAAAGFLVFDTSLAWPERTLKKVAQRIQEDLDLKELPRLAPLPFKSGTVRLTFLDRTTVPPGENPAAPGATPTEEQQRWVPVLEASGVPSLYGENRAIFSAMLTKRAAALLLGSFEGFMPAGVIYDLQFVGMQRAFNVHVEADWEQVYHHLAEGFSADFVFVQVNTEKILDELEEKKIVKITSSLEGVGEEAMQDEFDEVRKQLQEFVLEKFFTPQPNPNQPDMSGSGVDGVINAARRIHNAAHHWPTVGYSRTELNMTEVRSLDIDYTVARAVERRIAPQAHVSLFFEDYELTREQVVTVVDGDDALWREMEFDISANADFDGDGIHSISVDVVYGVDDDTNPDDVPASWSFQLNKEQTREKRSAWYEPDAGRKLRYRYTVHFTPGATPGPMPSVTSGWRWHEGNLLVITPQELYTKRAVEAQIVRNFPFERYPQVHVHMRYEDPATHWSHEDAELLDQTTTHMQLAFRTRPLAETDVDYRITYLRDGEPLETGWRRTDHDLVLVDNPQPDQLSVRIVVAGDKSKIMNLIVDLKYEDPDNGVHESDSILIDPSNINQIQTWKVPIEDPAKRRYWYNQTLIDDQGNFTQTGWMETDKVTLPVGIVYAKLMEVQPELVGPSLADNGVELIRLQLKYDDDINDLHLERQMVFGQPGKGELWRVPLKDASARDYSYELTYVMNTGFERCVGPSRSRDTFFILSSVPPAE